MVPALLLPASPADAAWPEAALAGTAPVEEPPGDEAPAEVPADEEPPVDEAPAEAPADETPPVEEPSGDVAPDEAAPAEAAPADEAAAEAATAKAPSPDEAPADVASAEEPPLEEPPAETATADAAPADGTPVEEPSAEEPPVEEPPADTALVEEPSGGVAPDREALAEAPLAEAPLADEAAAEAAPVETPSGETVQAGEAPIEAVPADGAWAGEALAEAASVAAVPADVPPADMVPAGEALAETARVEAPPPEAPPPEAVPVQVRPVETAQAGPDWPDAAQARPIPPGRAQRGTARPAEPGWGTVLATTVRLWTRRRLAKPRWRVAFALLLAVIVIAAVAIPIVLGTGSPGGQPGSRGNSHAGSAGTLGAAAVRRQAAVWVAQQVNGDAVAACDPAMCGALQKAGVPAARLLVLRPGQGDPLGSDILVATAAVRSQFGRRLAGVYAPVVVAAFGTGTARIDVRVEAPDGAAAYLAALTADMAARKAAGAQILHNAAIEASPRARRQLAAGQVDARLLVTLVTLSHAYRIDIISFGSGPASGVTPGVPLRFAEIAGAARGGHRPASLHALRAFLNAQRTPYRPSWVTTERIASRSVLHVEYPAPSPLGLLGSHG